MSIRIVRLGSERGPGEGLRIGTVRRVPRGVPADERVRFFDVWLPNLAPSEGLLHERLEFSRLVRKFRVELKRPETRHLLTTLAALSHQTNFSVGCYCEDENQCHRSVLREALAEAGAVVEG